MKPGAEPLGSCFVPPLAAAADPADPSAAVDPAAAASIEGTSNQSQASNMISHQHLDTLIRIRAI